MNINNIIDNNGIDNNNNNNSITRGYFDLWLFINK